MEMGLYTPRSCCTISSDHSQQYLNSIDLSWISISFQTKLYLSQHLCDKVLSTITAVKPNSNFKFTLS